MKIVQELITTLDLQSHPEGGFFKETYRSSETFEKECLPTKYSGPRNVATSIYFLLTSNSFSAFHRIKQDEIWHFYTGSPLEIHEIDLEGNYSCTRIGTDLQKGERPQYVVPAGHWFGATVLEKDSYSLVGCTVSPGFDFADFELAKRAQLTQKFPQHEHIVNKLTRI